MIPTAHIGKVLCPARAGALYAARALSSETGAAVLIVEPAPELLATRLEGLTPEAFEPDTDPRAMEVRVVRPSAALVAQWRKADVAAWTDLAVRRVAVEVRRYREAFGVLPRGISTGEAPGRETLPSGEDIHLPARFYNADSAALRRWVKAHFKAHPVAVPSGAATARAPHRSLPVAHTATDLWAFGGEEGAIPLSLPCYVEELGRGMPMFFGKFVRWVEIPGVTEACEAERAQTAAVAAYYSQEAARQAAAKAERDRERRVALVAMFGEPPPQESA